MFVVRIEFNVAAKREDGSNVDGCVRPFGVLALVITLGAGVGLQVIAADVRVRSNCNRLQ